MSDSTPPDYQTASDEWFYDDRGTRVGPVKREAVRELLSRGDISHDTLAWNRTFSQQWKPIRETDLAQTDMPPPLPASHVNDSFALLLALVPIIGALGEKAIANIWDVVLSGTQLFLIYAAVNSILSLSDARYIKRSGRNTKNIRLGIWFWLVPAYLFQRARALRRRFIYFWVWITSFAIGVFVFNPDILSGNTYWGRVSPYAIVRSLQTK